jgi:hypothetical protein
MKTFQVGTLTVRIEQDHDAEPPFSDGISIYYNKSSRYCLGDTKATATEMKKLEVKVIAGGLWGLPVYAYVHSGVALATTPFSCPWDSGRSGIAVCEKHWFDNEAEASQAIRAYVADYTQYLQGDVWQYTITDQSGNFIGSLSGCYGLEYCEAEARTEAECFNKEIESEANNINQAVTIK